MKLLGKSQARGFSLIELVVGMMLLGMLSAALYACADMLQKSQLVTSSRVEPRQQLRNAINRFTVFAAGATKFYTGVNATPGTHLPITINGYKCNLPYYQPPSGSTPGKWHPGDTIAIAVPEDLTRPTDDQVNPIPDRPDQVIPLRPLGSSGAIPDGFPDGTHTIVVLTAQLRQVESRDAGAQSLVLMRWERVSGPTATPREPDSINLTTLGVPTNIGIFDTSLDQGDDGFLVRYLLNDKDTPYASEILATFERTGDSLRPTTQRESYNYTFSTRNL